jgi:hypothetical protein
MGRGLEANKIVLFKDCAELFFVNLSLDDGKRRYVVERLKSLFVGKPIKVTWCQSILRCVCPAYISQIKNFSFFAARSISTTYID